jgi:dipeptidyl aminopeptidase/acylaminoacyl peptidase
MKKIILLTLISILMATGFAFNQDLYKLPPQEVVDIVTAPRPPSVSISPDGEKMLLVEEDPMPSIAYMALPLLRIAGIRILPKYNAEQETDFNSGITIKNIKDGTIKKVNLPPQAKLSYPRWSHDNRWFIFLMYKDNGVEAWVGNAKTGEAKAITGEFVNATLNSGYSRLPDNRHILVFTIPQDRGAPPKKSDVPAGPIVQQTIGKASKVRTYQDLLTSPHDEALFEYYTTSQIMEIDIQTGESKKIGSPGIFREADPSPDGKFILVNRIKRPFSYSVPYRSFPHSYEIWDREGNLIHVLADLPLADEVPIDGVATGARSVNWRPLKPATLVWVEALDGGDPDKQVPFRDKMMTLPFPFIAEPQEIMKIKERYSDIEWLQTVGKAFLVERIEKTRWQTTRLVDVDHPEIEPKTVFDLSREDQYNDPGDFVTTRTSAGESILLQDKDWVYLEGDGATPEGNRPFLDRMNIKTLIKERLFLCGEQSDETFQDFFGSSRKQIITQYQSKTEPPNYYIFDLKSKKREALTDNKDPAPQMTGMKKQLVKYKRSDGIELTGTLYLPKDYQDGDRLPLVLWAYPREYTDKKYADQVSTSPNRFTYFRGYSQLFFVTQGYAVFDGAEMPIVGNPETWNDTFVDQLVSSAQAAIDKLESMGVIDPKRVGVGGHSYGAFMTANLLSHCDLFAAGIARSGAYNRTLTPFGFQNESRTFWEAPQLYFKVSPFMHANKVNEPILLIHGEADNNSGTFPVQSRRYYHALKGHGATARLVMLPNESHGYRAKESVLHVLTEMIEWFDKYVKNKK